MTREEILKGYSDAEARDTWVALGSNVIKPNTKVYNADMLYQLEVECALKDALIYCRESYIGDVSWASASIVDGITGEITFGSDIINPVFVVILTPDQYNAIDKPINESFVPFYTESGSPVGTADVKISDEDYGLCLRCLGYPFINEDELEYTRDQIIELAIKPALERYYKWFPREIKKTYPITGDLQEEPFPDGAYDIMGFSVQLGAGAAGTGNVTHILWRYMDELAYGGGGWSSSITGTYNSIYPPHTMTNTAQTFIDMRTAQQAYINYNSRKYIDKIIKTDEYGNSKYYVRFHSNTGTLAQISFAIKDLDFNHVEFARRPEVIKLCNAEVKKLFGNLRRQVKSGIPGQVDYSSWVSEADKEIGEVDADWKNIVKYSSMVRGI